MTPQTDQIPQEHLDWIHKMWPIYGDETYLINGPKHDVAKAMYRYIQSQQPAGMKWVKASERLPEGDTLVCMRGDGGGCYYYETADRFMLADRLMEDEWIPHKFDPEWLDESQQPVNVWTDELIHDYGTECWVLGRHDCSCLSPSEWLKQQSLTADKK